MPILNHTNLCFCLSRYSTIRLPVVISKIESATIAYKVSVECLKVYIRSVIYHQWLAILVNNFRRIICFFKKCGSFASEMLSRSIFPRTVRGVVVVSIAFSFWVYITPILNHTNPLTHIPLFHSRLHHVLH